MSHQHRNHPAYWAFVLHRVSGVVLGLFLPAHFLVLRLAVEDARAMDAFLAWTPNPLVALAEAGLVVLLAAHLTGGLRLLAVEFLPWRNWQKTMITISGGVSLCAGLAFLLNAS